MTRGSLHIVPAALAFLAAVFVTDAAMAQCPSGTYSCGADYCTPDGAVCCAGVGLPQYYCPSGTYCTSDGDCESAGSSSSVSSSSGSSSTTGGGGYCPDGSYACGADYCTPDGAVCCANVGLPQYYCPSGSVCQSDGSCESGSSSNVSSSSGTSGTTGGGGYCPDGSYSCGADYCTPDGEVCCANVGLPQYYCPGGSVCQNDGSCAPGASSSASSSSSSSGTTGGADGCEPGSYACGADYCTPDGEVCCASVGLPQYYCPGGSVCQSDGSCDTVSPTGDSTSGSSTSGSNTSANNNTSGATSTSTSGGGTSGTGTSTTGSPPPQVEGCSSYYDHGYDEYQVEVQCQSAYIYACAGHQEGVTASCDVLEGWGDGSREACPYCTGTDPRESSGSKKKKSSGGGCALSPSGSPAGETAFLLTLLGFGGVLRRRSARRKPQSTVSGCS